MLTANLLKVFGIISFLTLVLTFLGGIRAIKMSLKIHRILGILTLLFAIGHGILIVILTYF